MYPPNESGILVEVESTPVDEDGDSNGDNNNEGNTKNRTGNDDGKKDEKHNYNDGGKTSDNSGGGHHK